MQIIKVSMQIFPKKKNVSFIEYMGRKGYASIFLLLDIMAHKNKKIYDIIKVKSIKHLNIISALNL